MQKLQLNIRKISILTGIGPDRISLFVPNNKVLDVVLGGTPARDLFPELYFELTITRGEGESLLAALGLKADEIISL